jgi:hypothetical protein
VHSGGSGSTYLGRNCKQRDVDPDAWKIEVYMSAHPVRNVNQLKATIVLDYPMQAADVAHTMQHWHIYRK